MTDYTSPQTYTSEGFDAMERAAERLRNALQRAPGKGATEALDAMQFHQRFIEAMDADLNTPQALAVLHDLAHEINRAAEAGRRVAEAQQTLVTLGGVLGLTFQGPGATRSQEVGPFITLLIDTRAELRAAGQYVLADGIRSGLAQLGIALEDTPQGTVWKYQN